MKDQSFGMRDQIKEKLKVEFKNYNCIKKEKALEIL